MDGVLLLSTIVEILLYYLTKIYLIDEIYIYNSRNSFILLNTRRYLGINQSTIVEILLYYLTPTP